jgi:hypothetical protein
VFWFAVSTTVALLVAGGLRRLDPVPAGLQAQFFANERWQPPAAVTRIDPLPGTWPLHDGESLAARAFSADWRGYLYAPRNGTYVIGVLGRGEVVVHLDHRPAIRGEGDDLTLFQAVVRLSEGSHQLVVRTRQPAGVAHLQLLWGSEGGALTAVPRSALRTRQVSVTRFRVARAVDVTFIALQWAWAAAMFIGIAELVRRAARRAWRDQEFDPALRWVVAGSVALNATGIWWGLPRERRWVPDELTPWTTIDAINARFSGGWFDAYPPFQNALLSVVYSPLLVLGSLGRLDFEDSAHYAVLTVVGRLVSVAMAAGIVVAIGLCATRVASRRAGLFAAISVALTAPFLYYAKTINVDVPYLFWFAVSMVCYLRALTEQRVRDFAWFAATGMFAICTKDQAYGLYVLTPIPLVAGLYRAASREGRQPTLWSVLRDRRVLAAAGVGLGVFVVAQNLVFNFEGFVKHLQYLQNFSRVTDSHAWTLSGRWDLALMTAHQVRQALGWVLTGLALIGLAAALVDPALRRYVGWLAVPVLSYYVTFINVVGYSYDRFMLPVCLVLGIFSGALLDRFTRRGVPWRGWRTALVSVLFAHAFAYSAAVDALMIADSRYDAERWLAESVRVGEAVGVTGVEYMPLTRHLHAAYIASAEVLARARPKYVVVNADSLRLAAPDTTPGLLMAALDRGDFGYQRVYSHRAPLPWSWLPGMHPVLVGDHRPALVLSNLHHINPLIEIYRAGP